MTDLGDSQEKLRLLVLSHQIAHFGIPAIYLNESPSYVNDNLSKNPVVLVFDLDSLFTDFSLPPFFKPNSIDFNFTDIQNDELFQHLQRSMTLFQYYHFSSDHPFYHTSYLLFSCTDAWSRPFILQYVPLHINNSLVFRSIVISNISIHVNSQNHISEHSIVLIPPYEHPFFVVEVTQNQLIAQSIDHNLHTFNRKDIIVSMVYKPSPSLYSLFDRPKSIQDQIAMTPDSMIQFCTFGNNDHFPLSKTAIDDFFKEKIRLRDVENGQQFQIKSSEFENPPPDIHTILSEQVLDLTIRRQISKSFIPTPFFPSNYLKAPLSPIQYNTFFERNYGLTSISLPLMLHSFYHQNPKQFIKIDIPNVLVNQKGQPLLYSAEKVISSWITEGFKPISGTKDFHYIVFADSLMNEYPIKQFFAHLTHTYSIFGFGQVTPFAKIPTYYFSNPEEIMAQVSHFLSKNAQLEFAEYPTIVFVICDKVFDPVIHPNFYIIYITLDHVRLSSFENLQELAFLIYARIRIKSASPLERCGQISSQKRFFVNSFYQFRYQPPFLLSRSKNKSISFYGCWDPATGMSVWTDDSGSILQCEKFKSITTIIQEFTECQNFLSDIKFYLYIGVLSKSLPSQIVDSAKSFSDVIIYSIYPTPYIQLGPSYEFIEDVLIVTKLDEIPRIAQNSMQPLSAGYVASKQFPAYFLALYKDSSITENHEESLQSLAFLLSNLSWLSVKPNSEFRTVGYPPILNILLHKISAPAEIVNQFEFLPYNDFY